MAKTIFSRKKNKTSNTSTLLPVTILHSIKTLKIIDYITCYEEKNYSLLIKSGNPTPDELLKHWLSIQIDYYDILETDKGSNYIGIHKQILQLTKKIKLLDCCFTVYLSNKNDDIKAIMSKLGFYFEKDAHQNIIIKQFTGYIKYLGIELKNRMKDLERVEQSNDENTQKTSTREIFINNIIEMKKEGYVIDIQNDTVEFYALTLKKFNQYIAKNAA